MKSYYVYIYRNPLKNNQIFYIGYGNRNRKKKQLRAYDHLEEFKRGIISKNKHKYYTLKEISEEGLEPIIEIYKDNLSKEEATEIERDLISINRSLLTNIAQGGDGGNTFSNQPEIRQKEIKDKLKAKQPTIWTESMKKKII